MKLNVANPATGQQKLFNIDDERRYRIFYDKRIAQEVPGDSILDEFKGYIFRITGGNDKQGFPMKQGVLVPHRVKLLLSEGHSCYRPRRAGERKRKSVRGCIVGPDIAVLAVIIVKLGDEPIAGLTDTVIPKKYGPKRATKIRRLFNLTKEDDVRKYVIRQVKPPKEDKPDAKPRSKAPKIQRLITPMRLQRKRRQAALKRRKRTAQAEQKAEYEALLSKRVAEKKAAAAAALAHKKDGAPKKAVSAERKERVTRVRSAYRAARVVRRKNEAAKKATA